MANNNKGGGGNSRDAQASGSDGNIEGAPAIIGERSKSEPPAPPESMDVEVLSYEEHFVGKRVNTLDHALIPDENGSEVTYMCVGRQKNSGKIGVVPVPARKHIITPGQVVQFRGHVIQDHMSTHSAAFSHRKRRYLYVFDRFYEWEGKRWDRCCYVPDELHRAFIMFEKVVSKRTRKAFSRLKRIPGTNDPMYALVKDGGKNENDYRALRRLFDREVINRDAEDLADVIGLPYAIATE